MSKIIKIDGPEIKIKLIRQEKKIMQIETIRPLFIQKNIEDTLEIIKEYLKVNMRESKGWIEDFFLRDTCLVNLKFKFDNIWVHRYEIKMYMNSIREYLINSDLIEYIYDYVPILGYAHTISKIGGDKCQIKVSHKINNNMYDNRIVYRQYIWITISDCLNQI